MGLVWKRRRNGHFNTAHIIKLIKVSTEVDGSEKPIELKTANN